MLSLNPNPPREVTTTDLAPPRDSGRGVAIRSDGVAMVVSYHGDGVYVGLVRQFDLVPAPTVLDFAYDQLDRPQIVYTVNGLSYIYFFDGTLNGFRTLELGVAEYPAIFNDYDFLGVNTVAGYLRDGTLYMRLQSDRYGVEYVWWEGNFSGIQKLGRGLVGNTIQAVVW